MNVNVFSPLLLTILLTGQSACVWGQSKHVPVPPEIPYGRTLKPRMQEPVFAVCSKQGMRILVSRDDGLTWQQTFLGSPSAEDGGWHGTFAVYGMAATNGVIGVFSGWGSPGVYIGSDDGLNWGHLQNTPQQLGSVWSAAGGNGVLLTSADQWRGMTSSNSDYSGWTKHSVKDLLNGGRTHHMICGFGDYREGRYLVVGDNRHAFYSDDCQSWRHSLIPASAGERQQVIAFGNGVFLVGFGEKVARSDDGGVTWSVHETGLRGRGMAWRGLSFVRGRFWLTAKGGTHSRCSEDGIDWEDLPSSTPGGRFVEAESGTLINVERQRYDIKRSVDGQRWDSVFQAPVEDVTWDTSFAVYQKVNATR